MWKRKREHEEQWEGTREKRVSYSIINYFLVSLLLLLVVTVKTWLVPLDLTSYHMSGILYLFLLLKTNNSFLLLVSQYNFQFI